MTRHALSLSLVLTLALALLTAGACGPPYYVQVDHDPVVATMPPPADIAEEPGPLPWPGAVWVHGYWYWTGETYVWVAGAWSRPPAIGYVWVRTGWVFLDGRYRFMPGRWAHPRRVPRYPYYRPPPHRPSPPHHRPTPPPHRPSPQPTRPPPHR